MTRRSRSITDTESDTWLTTQASRLPGRTRTETGSSPTETASNHTGGVVAEKFPKSLGQHCRQALHQHLSEQPNELGPIPSLEMDLQQEAMKAALTSPNVRQFDWRNSLFSAGKLRNKPRNKAWTASGRHQHASLTAESHYHPFTALHRSSNFGQNSARIFSRY